MEKRLDEILEIIERRFEPNFEKIESFINNINSDVLKYIDRAIEPIDLIESVVENERMANILGIPFMYQKKGLDSVKTHLGSEYNLFNQYLNSQIDNDLKVIGFNDGFLNTYIGTSIQRIPNSIQYQRGVEIGNNIGEYTILFLFDDKEKVDNQLNDWFSIAEKYLKNKWE